MALSNPVDRITAQPIIEPSSQPLVEPAARRDNVIPFPSARGLLPVTLPHSAHAPANTQLRALLHSPLGVYVVSTDIVRGEIRAQLDIAVEDLNFTLHTLISLVPVATIGRMTRRPAHIAAR